jgi:hypothetical protein
MLQLGQKQEIRIPFGALSSTPSCSIQAWQLAVAAQWMEVGTTNTNHL